MKDFETIDNIINATYEKDENYYSQLIDALEYYIKYNEPCYLEKLEPEKKIKLTLIELEKWWKEFDLNY